MSDDDKSVLQETNEYPEEIYQLKVKDKAEGGPDGILNQPLRELANRTRFLKGRIGEVEGKIPGTEEFTRIYQEIKSADVSKLATRVDHLERTTGDMALVMDANMMYPQGDAYLVENFDNPDKVDLTEVEVSSAISGDDSINVADVSNLVIGANYTLTDGINQEIVQIKSISTSTTTKRVILENAVVNQYDETRTKLYRSSVAIYDGKAYSGGNIRTEIFEPALDFKGSTTQKEITAQFGAFTNEGDYTLTGITFENGKAVLGSQALGIALISTGGRTGTWARVTEEGEDA